MKCSKSSETNFKLPLTLVLLFSFASGCAKDKVKEQESHSAPKSEVWTSNEPTSLGKKNVRSPSVNGVISSGQKVSGPESGRSKSGKLTPSLTGSDQGSGLKVGMSLRFQGIKRPQAQLLADVIRGQISLFTGCVSNVGKSGLVRLNAEFVVSSEGLAEDIRVVEVMPPSEPFKECFLNQIDKLDVGTGYGSAKVFMGIGTYTGDTKDWDGVDKKYE